MTRPAVLRAGSSRFFTPIALVVATLLVASAALAAVPVMTPSVPTCVSRDGNTLVSLSVKPETGWSTVRVYFRRGGLPEFYYIEMRSDGAGRYWATLPRPEAGTKSADIQFAVRDAEGVETRSALQAVSVISPCTVTLSPDQERFAHNLVVGETVAGQSGQSLSGWQCTGVISRINMDGQLRPDATCRAAIIAMAADRTSRLLLPAAFVGGAALGGVIVHTREPDECSACRVKKP